MTVVPGRTRKPRSAQRCGASAVSLLTFLPGTRSVKVKGPGRGPPNLGGRVSVRTKDDIAETVGNALDLLEEADLRDLRSVLGAVPEAVKVLRALHEELAVGRVEREKSRRRKAKARRLSTGAEVPLWGE